MITAEDQKLLRVGDVIYSWHSYLMGNTTIRARSIYETHITRIGDEIWGSWNGNLEQRIYRFDRYMLHHPKPHRTEYTWSRGSDRYDDDVKRAAERAAVSRRDWRERRKAAKLAKRGER